MISCEVQLPLSRASLGKKIFEIALFLATRLSKIYGYSWEKHKWFPFLGDKL